MKPPARTYLDARGLIDREYNSVVIQAKVENHLALLRVDHLIDRNTDSAAAFARVYRRVLSISRQVPKSHKGNTEKTKLLRGAVIGLN